jgi:hypothetical protein
MRCEARSLRPTKGWRRDHEIAVASLRGVKPRTVGAGGGACGCWPSAEGPGFRVFCAAARASLLAHDNTRSVLHWARRRRSFCVGVVNSGRLQDRASQL